ncbi:MAG: hypothetical protein BVN35_17550 [Proteobacteria bacterium ST_bin11]|nr:MAG: hypothetical protein BVN35_17550 [Proteobacteria bacterium ST_bin11]
MAASSEFDDEELQRSSKTFLKRALDKYNFKFSPKRCECLVNSESSDYLADDGVFYRRVVLNLPAGACDGMCLMFPRDLSQTDIYILKENVDLISDELVECFSEWLRVQNPLDEKYHVDPPPGMPNYSSRKVNVARAFAKFTHELSIQYRKHVMDFRYRRILDHLTQTTRVEL